MPKLERYGSALCGSCNGYPKPIESLVKQVAEPFFRTVSADPRTDQISKIMSEKQAGILLPMTVTEGVSVHVLPNEQHEFLMTTKEVANGYCVTEYAIRQNKVSLGLELTEGKHYVLAVSIPHGELPSALKTAHNAVLWTKRGIVRLGFAMRSERAKLFRDWAEELIIRIDQQRNLLGSIPVQPKQLPAKRKHNRLTQERMISILADVCKIEDKDLRLSISQKLMMKGGVQW